MSASVPIVVAGPPGAWARRSSPPSTPSRAPRSTPRSSMTATPRWGATWAGVPPGRMRWRRCCTPAPSSTSRRPPLRRPRRARRPGPHRPRHRHHRHRRGRTERRSPPPPPRGRRAVRQFLARRQLAALVKKAAGNAGAGHRNLRDASMPQGRRPLAPRRCWGEAAAGLRRAPSPICGLAPRATAILAAPGQRSASPAGAAVRWWATTVTFAARARAHRNDPPPSRAACFARRGRRRAWGQDKLPGLTPWPDVLGLRAVRAEAR